MFSFAFIPLRALPYVIAGGGIIIGSLVTLAVEHKLLPWMAKGNDESEPAA